VTIEEAGFTDPKFQQSDHLLMISNELGTKFGGELEIQLSWTIVSRKACARKLDLNLQKKNCAAPGINKLMKCDRRQDCRSSKNDNKLEEIGSCSGQIR